MKKKTLLLLIAILTIVTLFFVLNRDNSNTLSGDAREFNFKSTDKIDKIFISNKKTGNYVILKKQDSIHWTVNDSFPAEIEKIKILFEGLRNVRVKRPVSKNEISTVRKDIATMGTKVEIYENGSISKVFYIGGNGIGELGSYYLMENAEEPFLCHIPGFNGYPGSRFFDQTIAWRSKKIFGIQPESIATVSINWNGDPLASFTIDNLAKDPVLKNGTKTFINGQEANLNLIKTYLKFWDNLSYEGFPIDLNAHQIDSISRTPVLFSISLSDKSGNITTLDVHKKGIKMDSPQQTDDEGNPLQFEQENYYAFINGNKREIVQIQDYVFGKVMKKTQDFLLKQ